MKKLYRMLLLLCAITMVFVLPAMAAEIVDSGTCGENLTWTLDDEGLLTISGSGEMYDYHFDAPWSLYSIYSIVIGDGVTTIGECAFSYSRNDTITDITMSDSVKSIGYCAFNNCLNLINIKISNSLSIIGDSAFSSCQNLTSITIPDSVMSIGHHAFNNCYSLASISIPDGVTSIGEGTFSHCEDITSVVIPNSVTSIGSYAFLSCCRLASITIPDGVTSIGDYAFVQCQNLASITIPDSVKSIGEGAFSHCKSLPNITIPDSVTHIGNDAFLNCKNIKSIAIPDSVTSIGQNAFSCGDLFTSINVDPDNGYYRSIDGVLFSKDGKELLTCPRGKVGSYVIPDSVTNICNKAFYSCTGLTSITIPDSITSIGDDVFMFCDLLATINVDSDNEYYQSIDGVLFSKDGKELLTCPCGKVGSYVIPDSVTNICNEAFYSCTGLTSITIPDNVTSIGNSAFFDCSGLTSVTIPNGVTSIGKTTFYGCSSLTSIMLSDNVTSIGNQAFSNCNSLTSITIPNGVTSIANDAFLWSKNLNHVIFESNAPVFEWTGYSPSALNFAFTIYYYEGTTGWSTPTWTDFNGTIYNTVMISNEHEHSMTYHASTANCKGTGYPEHWYCETCELTFADEAGTQPIEIKANALNPENHAGGTEIRNAKDATEFVPGYTGDTYCLGCNTKIATGTVIPATHEHHFTDATCTAPQTCSCGAAIGEKNPDHHAGPTKIMYQNALYTGDEICTACGNVIHTGNYPISVFEPVVDLMEDVLEEVGFSNPKSISNQIIHVCTDLTDALVKKISKFIFS